ncbi:WD repeat-containing protein 81 [Hondaea fermentalgiana]|uniref:WD repeat-containing protein 81 n=1 Tax=Hondaea fermentalgiana TaxID=2315210 RepID=A0A2R5GRA0_9STRA|nr:WD repeat-containing protein 81 [Hondaea fermentalgiana]|eukprot:GBG30404.1 WD repeat-containing protein 81 [Hondaea fermentalgiana]
MSLKRLVQAQLGVEGAVFPHDADFAGSTREEDERADTDTARNGVDGTASDPDVEPVANLEKGEQAGETSTPRPASEKTSARPLTSGKAQCLVEGVVRDKEQTISLVDPTTKCAVVTVFALGKPALDSTIRTTHKLNCTTDLQATDSDFMDRPQIQNVESAHDHGDEDAATADAADGGSVARTTYSATLSEGLTEAWRQGRVSNLDYLMAVNAAAGRHLADANFHPVIPWVTDFSSSDLDDPEQTHWRDLTQSKYRLAKGDDQLDITFCNSPTPHHITESLSEITYYIYMARVTPLATLRSVVRSNFEAKEYPASMARMYEWTPDECIPEFFFDASVFSSMHADIDLPDLGFPKWCRDASDFVRWHRAALESTHVSRSLHHWIDLNFGNKLAGEAAVASKNVTLPLSSMPKHRLRKSPGFVQVFTEAHPAREVENAGNARGNMDNFERGARFERFFGPMIAPTYTKLESEKDRADACLDVARWQADDCFALGCIAAEMYLRQPLLTSSRRHALLSRDEAVAVDLILPELRRLPRRVRDFVGRALTAPKLDALLDLVGETVFPDWFAAVYDFLSASQHCRTWLERFHWVKKELGPLLERVSDDPSERKRALNLAMPSVLALMLEANDEVRALMPIELVLIAGPLLDVRELLPTVVETYERMQAKEQWSLLLPALEAKTCMRVLDYVGATTFANLYPPLLVETLRSSTAPANVRAAAADAAIALARAPTFGIALSVRMILTPLLKRWQVTRASLGEGGVNRGTYAHLRQFGIEALAPAKLTALLDKFCSILDGGPARSRTDLVLPVHAPAVKVIRYVTARAGRMVATELVFPAAFKALSKTFLQNDASEEERIQASVRRMDVLSFFSCVLSMLEEEDLYAWFLERSELRELLAAQPGETVEDQLASVYVAVLLGLVVSHVGHHEIAPVLEASANALRAAAAPRCPPGQLWMARFIFAAFEARWGEERIRAYYPTLAPSNLRRCLAIPDSYREPGPSQVAVPRRDQGVGKLELTQDAPRDCVFDAGINTDNGDPCSPSGGAHEDMEAAVEVADEFEDELGAEELLLVETTVNSDEVGVREGEVEERDARQESEARAGLEEQARMERTWLLGPDLGSESTSSASAVPEVFAKRRKRGTLRGAVSHVLRAHQTAIITIEANSDETLLASTSRSSSVKLFSIAGKPREVASFRNARPVSGLRFLELGRKCILLDGAVRLWDVEYGHERSRGAEGNFVAGSPPRLRTVPIGVAHRPVLTVQSAGQQSLANENVIWASTIAGTVDCLDFRVPGHTVSSHQLPAVDESPSTVPLQRSQAHQASSASNGGFCASSIVCGGSFSGGWIAAGRASGHVSVLDARTGGSLAHWKAHEGGVVSLQALNLVQPVIQTDELVHEAAAYQLLSISAEGSARVWDVSRQGGFENAGDVPWNSQPALFEAPVLETSPSTAESGVSGTGVSRGAEDGTVAESAPLAQDTLEAASSLRRSESAGFGNTASALDDLTARFARVSDAKSSVMSPPSPSRGGNNRRGGRVYVSIPQCDTASIWSETATQGRSPTKLVIGADNRISVVTLEMRARATEVTAKPVVLRDFKGEGIGRGALRIGALRVLPMRGLVLVAGDNGCIHSVV